MKKILILIGSLFVIGLLSGCSDPVVEETVDPLEFAYDSLVLDDVLDGTSLPIIIDGVAIVWTSDIEDIVSINGTITLPSEDTDIELEAVLTYESRTMVKVFNVTVSMLVVIDPICETGETLIDGECVVDAINPICEIDEELVDGVCQDIVVEPTCEAGETLVDGECVVDTVGPVYTGYYAGAENLSGDILKAFLHNLIDDHTSISYTAARDALTFTDEDPNNSNNVILIYTGDSIAKTYICSSSCPNDSWNREHVWPQSLGDFGTGDVPGTDIHALRPSDVTVNSTRGSLDFDEGGNIVYNDGTATLNYYDGDSFEPRDDVKGDIARMIFYMAVRYEGDDGYQDLEINELTGTGYPTIGVLSVLLQWHIDDPVDDFEINRNNVIETYQHNRNPFIDHPEFVSLIWGS